MFSTRLQKFAKPFSSFLQGGRTNHQCFSSTSYNTIQPSSSESIFTRIQNHQSFSAVPLEQNRLIRFDKLTETYNSETYRGFDRTLQKFVSIKNIDLRSGSLESLEQVLIQLKLGSPQISPCQGIFLDKSAQKMTVISDCNYKLLSDYSQFKLENNISWKNEELLSLSLQLLHHLSAFERVGGSLGASSIQPQNLFLTSKSGLLKFHSLSDFHFAGEKVRVNDGPPLSKILSSLVKITNPLFSGPEQATYSYLEKRYPEFLETLQTLMINSKENENIHSFNHALNGVEFDQYVQNKLKTMMINPEWRNEVINSFSQDKSSGGVKENLEASLKAFQNALLLRNKLPEAIIQQVEQEYKKVYELLELIDPKAVKSIGNVDKRIEESKVKLILMSLGEDFFTSLNLGGVLKGTFIFALYFFAFMSVTMSLIAVAEYIAPETPQFSSESEATQNQQETNKTS